MQHDVEKPCNRRIVNIKQPIGVAGMIAPWNFPAAMIARKVAPAIAVGCTVVIKPPSLTPISALALAKLAHQAGIPAGVINIVPTDKTNSSAVGRAICESPDVAALSFTGSTNVGKLLLKQCAGTVKKEFGSIHYPKIIQYNSSARLGYRYRLGYRLSTVDLQSNVAQPYREPSGAL